MTVARNRQPRNLDAGPFEPVIRSFKLHLNAEGKSPKTVNTYVEAVQWFAGQHLRSETDRVDWAEVVADDLKAWMVWLLDRYSDSYANNQYRALQQFFKWYADEEDLPNPMAKMKPPRIKETVVPVFTEDELSALSRTCGGKTFVDRRDQAIVEMFKATGIRLFEMADINYVPNAPDRSDIDLDRRELIVRGKGGKERRCKFGFEAARAVDRYVRLRSKHTHAESPKLWLGVNNRPPMTAHGIYQMIVRRGEDCGVAVNPHKFRHHFSHTWLDNGGGEGDLMELNGWTSPQMLARYGASARNARARRTYDRIMSGNK
ncbi:integrase/recombinase XerD [Nocardia tenerifensis]|uniref:Integrase/recombinase XerD n=1 Tax=Nocardia tenerifensis TaxID=228006 RepID=A0A318K4C8_9NOCA|nr:tyrosine-type recombinase/integrase [Nocardia tenerifensis]PXX66944.1 integrase/recombinase XerD [Nocardia tenerifensis]